MKVSKLTYIGGYYLVFSVVAESSRLMRAKFPKEVSCYASFLLAIQLRIPAIIEPTIKNVAIA